jgi:Holliday junction DNA helicase RuvA
MIASLSGSVSAKAPGFLIIDVHGVGFQVFVTPQIEAASSIGSSISLNTALIVREDAFTLFGFAHSGELQLFDTLRSVSGVGPKTAMAIIAQLGIERISAAVVSQDDKVFSSVTGIGPKTAKLLTVALEGKVANAAPSSVVGSSNVLMAMVGLGWPEVDALEAIELVRRNLAAGSDDATLLKATLSFLANEKSQIRGSR